MNEETFVGLLQEARRSALTDLRIQVYEATRKLRKARKENLAWWYVDDKMDEVVQAWLDYRSFQARIR